MLDTNMFSYIADGRSPAARANLRRAARHGTIAISVITEGEVLYGLARKPGATRLRMATEEMLRNVEILPLDSAAAHSYATLRARMTAQGKALTALDTLIAAHAVAANAILITRDHAFSQINALRPVVNWATDL